MTTPEEFAQALLDGSQLLACADCGVPTAHLHEEVLAAGPGLSEVLMSCAVCGCHRTWLDVTPSVN